jgi:hypothetical protein
MLTNLVKKTIPVVALGLAASATVCLADTKGKTKRQPANAQTNYYHEKVGNSDIQSSGLRLESRHPGTSPKDI